MQFLQSRNAIKKMVFRILAILVIPLAVSFSTLNPALAASPSEILEGVKAGVQAFGDVVSIYDRLNPGQEGFVHVLNKLDEPVTVRSYNNNDWLMWVAAGQTNLIGAGSEGFITAKTNPVKLIWKRGEYGTLSGFGTEKLGQSVAPKGGETVFVIGNENTP
jgi:hypothetical protein